MVNLKVLLSLAGLWTLSDWSNEGMKNRQAHRHMYGKSRIRWAAGILHLFILYC